MVTAQQLHNERQNTRAELHKMFEELDTILNACRQGRNIVNYKTLRRVKPSFNSENYGFSYIKHVAKDESHVIFVVTVKPNIKLPGFKCGDAHCYFKVVSGEVYDVANDIKMVNNYIYVFKPGSLLKFETGTSAILEIKFKVIK